jgi:hypothetical protein
MTEGGRAAMRLIIRRIALYVITAIVTITINFFLPRRRSRPGATGNWRTCRPGTRAASGVLQARGGGRFVRGVGVPAP